MTANGDGFTPRDRWSTTISQANSAGLLLRGYPLIEVIRSLSFTEGTYLTLVGRLPDDRERAMFDALLNALLDHQFVSASVPAARYVASGNPQVVPAAAAGILSAGANTLSPEDCANLIREALALAETESLPPDEAALRIVTARREKRQRVPGLGHPLYKDADPRAVGLHDIARQHGYDGPAVTMMLAIHAQFLASVGKQVALNVDGMMSAIMLEMGFSPRQMVAVNLISYFPGILAHCVEEIEEGVPLRTIPDQLSAYAGAGLRHLAPATGA